MIIVPLKLEVYHKIHKIFAFGFNAGNRIQLMFESGSTHAEARGMRYANRSESQCRSRRIPSALTLWPT
jgi:hypothetical protein